MPYKYTDGTRLNHIPGWLYRRLQKRVRGELNPTSWNLLCRALKTTGKRDWLDHFGSFKNADGGVDFISEPYDFDAEDVQAFCDLLGLTYRTEPGHWCESTTRIVILQPEQSAHIPDRG
jgi:hypothetical protein